MSGILSVLLGLVVVLSASALLSWFAATRLKKAADPVELIFRWLVTIAAVTFWAYLGSLTKRSDPITTFLYICVAAGTGIFVAYLWAPRIGEMMASPFTRLYD